MKYGRYSIKPRDTRKWSMVGSIKPRDTRKWSMVASIKPRDTRKWSMVASIKPRDTRISRKLLTQYITLKPYLLRNCI